MAQKIQIRRGTTSQWSTANPILASGEMGYDTDIKRIKIGNGTTAWNSLPFEIADVQDYQITIPDTGWLQGGMLEAYKYYIDVSVSGILSSDEPILDINPAGFGSPGLFQSDPNSVLTEWAKIFRAEVGTNVIRFWATEIPTMTLYIKAKVVR